MLRWLRNSFLTGIIVATPVTVTVWLIYAFITFVDSTIKPLIPDRYNPETYLPFALPGMGLIIAVLGLTLLGALAANIFGRSLLAVGERIVNTMPLVRNIYGALKQLVETVLGAQNNAFKEVVLVEYPMAGSYAVAFVASHGRGAIRHHVGKGKDEVIGVFVPTTPNPTSGFLLFVPRSKAIPLDITIEEAAKLIISFGLVTPDRLPEGAHPAGSSVMPDDPEAGEDAPRPNT
ncbi:MAG: DUF502 domain-containing protein [Caulobacterales bacterium]|uniref:DUF502 domain-containing protein n=1 Tax=Glycocaulis sp. TaxID=1969725 RepID=UPI003FA13ADA